MSHLPSPPSSEPATQRDIAALHAEIAKVRAEVRDIPKAVKQSIKHWLQIGLIWALIATINVLIIIRAMD